ncbi:unnamed protein product [Protopolystoma xenopodis]|uniref:SET domain-containing protein n=1 Tax=Protopolystoma xenopodis TaxID=117903 RepID=A0A3S5B4V8_9PLAT|nr:unnamed protein product [Protopolystoma xenopodis]
MLPRSDDVHHMTDVNLARFHRNRRRLPRKQRKHESSSKANQQLVKMNRPSSSGGTDLRISSPKSFTRSGSVTPPMNLIEFGQLYPNSTRRFDSNIYSGSSPKTLRYLLYVAPGAVLSDAVAFSFPVYECHSLCSCHQSSFYPVPSIQRPLACSNRLVGLLLEALKLEDKYFPSTDNAVNQASYLLLSPEMPNPVVNSRSRSHSGPNYLDFVHFQLETFDTCLPRKGLGVRCRRTIQKGELVTIYLGEVVPLAVARWRNRKQLSRLGHTYGKPWH